MDEVLELTVTVIYSDALDSQGWVYNTVMT